jgi:hypothetical protein
MAYFDTQQQNPMQNPQLNPQLWALLNPQNWQGSGYGSGQGAYGQAFGAYGNQPLFGSNPGWGGQPQWWSQHQQRQLSQQDVSEVVRQLLPASQQSTIPFGYAAYGQTPRSLSQQDVTEVVRQILPFVPQIVGMLQGQPQQGLPFGQYGSPQFQSAFGSPIWGHPQRQLTQQDVAEITRQLVGVIPQVIGNLQSFNQQRMI